MDRLLATKSEGVGPVGLIARTISFQDFQPICDHNSPMSQTDRRTDDMRSQDRACGKNYSEPVNWISLTKSIVMVFEWLFSSWNSASTNVTRANLLHYQGDVGLYATNTVLRRKQREAACCDRSV